MCEHGINIAQMKLAIGQSNDAIAMVQQWLEQLHHLADHGAKPEASAALAQAGVLLGEARAKLEEAVDDLEGRSTDKTTVELI
ncbi:MAG: hypothetical protein HGA39_08180 [Coriobacteriia bacterium]|nr:hypothetical protein [Coriobacteriia bacterium]